MYESSESPESGASERITSYRQLLVWQTAMDLVTQAYELTRRLPDAERFGPSSQLQRAATSIALNIAEGWGRDHRREYLHHLSMARGSLMEVETLLQIALRLNYIDKETGRPTWETAQRVGQMLSALITSLRNSSKPDRASQASNTRTPIPEPRTPLL